jgi:Spy/CpxP family protein refolding chaperone
MVMKKVLFLALLFTVVTATTTNAQTASGPAATAQQTKESDPALMLQQTKEKVRPLMVEKTGLTDSQADRVIEILFEMRQGAAALQGLSDADRSAKLAELKAVKDKKMSEVLTPEQIIAVKKFYEEMGKNMQQKSAN